MQAKIMIFVLWLHGYCNDDMWKFLGKMVWKMHKKALYFLLSLF